MVHLAVYFYFVVALVGRQWVKVELHAAEKDASAAQTLNSYVPIFLIFEFLFYVGWLNVAAALYNPFGDDDDDFAVMGLLNRLSTMTRTTSRK